MRLLKTVTAAAFVCGVSAGADAHRRNEWKVSVVRLYFWATSLDGDLSARPATVPVLKFSDLADDDSGAFQSETIANSKVNDDRWTMPINVVLSKLSTFGAFPASYQLGVGAFPVHPELGPSWKIRGAIVILLPRR